MPEWYESLDAPMLEQVTAKGWAKPASEIVGDIFKSYTGAQSLIGSDPAAIVKLPKDASDPAYAGILDRVVGLGLPKAATDYKFDGLVYKDGSTFDDDDAAFVRDFAHANKLSPAQARALAGTLMERAQSAYDADQQGAATAKTANETALRAAWGADYEQNAARAALVADALKAKGVSLTLDGLDAAAHVTQMNALLGLSQELRESPMLRGGLGMQTPTAMTPETAQARFDELKNNPEWFNKAWGQPGSPEAAELHNLQAYMAGVTPEEFTRFKAGGRIERR